MFKKLRASGYIKTSLISLAIVLLAVGTVVVLDWRDNAAKAPPAETIGANGGADFTIPLGQGDGAGETVPGETGMTPMQPAMTEEEVIAFLDSAVEGGRMTREQADAALERFRSGEGFAFSFGGEGNPGATRVGPGEGGTLPEGVEVVRGEDGTMQFFKDGVPVEREDVFPDGQFTPGAGQQRGPGQGMPGGGMNPSNPSAPAESPSEPTDAPTDSQGG